MTTKIRIATMGVSNDYRQSLVPLIIQSAGFEIHWTPASNADLIIFGPFFKIERPYRWAPKHLRPIISALAKRLQRRHRPLTLFQTAENLRHNHIPCDYSISFDLAVDSARHCRLPYWMEMVDWRHEGITGNKNARFGHLLNLDSLMQPLGKSFILKPKQAAIFGSHLLEPRTTLIDALSKVVPVCGFGPAFDNKIKHHSQSFFSKSEVLADFAFNLCPENSMYPGYYTEKIPEAFMANCLPLTWTDGNVTADFNPNAMVNLAEMMSVGFYNLKEILLSNNQLARYSEHALLLKKPSLNRLRALVHEVAKMATQ